MLDQCFQRYSLQMLASVSKDSERSTKIDTKLNKSTAGLLRTFNNANSHCEFKGSV